MTVNYSQFRHLRTSLEGLSVYMSLDKIKRFPAYKNIIAMGDVAKPFIMDILREGDRWMGWFTLLHELTPDMNPVADHERDDPEAMVRAWLKLAEIKGW